MKLENINIGNLKMANSPDPLDEIFVDENIPADKKMLAEILKPFATIDSRGIIAFTEEYAKLKESKKVLVFMLCKKAMILHGVPEDSEQTNVKEVVKNISVNESSAKNALFTFFKGVVKGGIIPNYNLKKAKEIIFEEDKK
jgi:hypothetical protein